MPRRILVTTNDTMGGNISKCGGYTANTGRINQRCLRWAGLAGAAVLQILRHMTLLFTSATAPLLGDEQWPYRAWPEHNSIPIIAVEAVVRKLSKTGEEGAHSIGTRRKFERQDSAARALFNVQSASRQVERALRYVVPTIHIYTRVILMHLNFDGNGHISNGLNDDNVWRDLDHVAHILVSVILGGVAIHSAVP